MSGSHQYSLTRSGEIEREREILEIVSWMKIGDKVRFNREQLGHAHSREFVIGLLLLAYLVNPVRDFSIQDSYRKILT